ncbi:MAG TPA: hypothetical protein VL475_06810, partial [Planctomycetaceae bacterium]|nr:hypothetical protein [Planctomycetaceae bacterium]
MKRCILCRPDQVQVLFAPSKPFCPVAKVFPFLEQIQKERELADEFAPNRMLRFCFLPVRCQMATNGRIWYR